MSETRPYRAALIGAGAGAVAWPVCAALFAFLPAPLRFVAAWLAFTVGPAAPLEALLPSRVDPLARGVMLLGVGSAAAPVLIVLLGWLHRLDAFPFIAFALGGIGVARARINPAAWSGPRVRADLWAAAALAVLAAGLGAIAFRHRLAITPGGLSLFGAYDSMDLSYYAVMAAESSHTVPPTASFYAGHGLNAAYYPQLVLAMVHRFAAVPLLDIYFAYAWPAFLAAGAIAAFVLARSLASLTAAILTVTLILVGGDFSYLAAWFLPHATDQWDYLLWPTNFLSPTMEVLHFNTWTPTLPIFFAALLAIVRSQDPDGRRWTLVAGGLIAVLFQFKPFAFIVILAGLSATWLFSWGDGLARRRCAAIAALSGTLALPFAYEALTASDRRSHFLIALFLLPQRMLIKLDLVDPFERAGALMPIPGLRHALVVLLATALFFAGGLGVRWLGLRPVWRAIRTPSGEHARAWRVLAWVTIAGITLPFVLVTDPYVDTLQFYQTGLYVLCFFTGTALASFAQSRGRVGAIAIAAVIAASLPSSVHFLYMKWTDNRRAPRVVLSQGELAIAKNLRDTDPETTVILHDRPADPSLLAIISERRVVLGWGHPYYAVGSASRLNDVNQFYRSADGDAVTALDTFRRYHVTHVVITDRSRVHADVLSRLHLLLRAPGAALYGVPPDLR